MIEFCCNRCRRVTREPEELHEGFPTTCTPCAVTATKPLPPPTRSVRGDIPPPEPPPMRHPNGDTTDLKGVRRNARGVVIGAPPPTTEYRSEPGPYDWWLALVVAASSSAGFIVGFLVRGVS